MCHGFLSRGSGPFPPSHPRSLWVNMQPRLHVFSQVCVSRFWRLQRVPLVFFEIPTLQGLSMLSYGSSLTSIECLEQNIESSLHYNNWYWVKAKTMPLKLVKMHFNNFVYLALYQRDGSKAMCKRMPKNREFNSTFQWKLTHHMVSQDRRKTRYWVFSLFCKQESRRQKHSCWSHRYHDDRAKSAVSEGTRRRD